MNTFGLVAVVALYCNGLGSCRISDSLAQTKLGVIYRQMMPRSPDSRYATPTNSS